jgi:hypothetical protein
MAAPAMKNTKSFTVGGIRVLYLVGPKQDLCDNIQLILDKIKAADDTGDKMLALRLADTNKGLTVQGWPLKVKNDDYAGASKAIIPLVQIDNTAAMVEEIDEVNSRIKTAHVGRDN